MKNIYEYIGKHGYEFYKIIKEASKLYSTKILPGIASLHKEIPNVSDERRHELEKFCETLLSHGWVMFNYLPLTVYDTKLTSKSSTNSFVMKYLNKENLNKIYQSLAAGKIGEYNLREIKKGFTIRAYKSTSILLVSLIENYIVTEYKITQKNRLQNKEIDTIKDLNTDTSNNKVSLFFYLHNYSLYIAIKYMFDSHDFKSVDDSSFCIPNRHFLMHGFSKRKYSKKDCLCLLLILYGLIEQKDMVIKDNLE
jgi:CRISPR/Cas system-associated protein endoribonuclease Cas2